MVSAYDISYLDSKTCFAGSTSGDVILRDVLTDNARALFILYL